LTNHIFYVIIIILKGEIKMKKFYCPVNGWDCPYWNKDQTCQLGETALTECVDAAAMETELEEDEILIMEGYTND
jgi:hypothetical protein